MDGVEKFISNLKEDELRYAQKEACPIIDLNLTARSELIGVETENLNHRRVESVEIPCRLEIVGEDPGILAISDSVLPFILQNSGDKHMVARPLEAIVSSVQSVLHQALRARDSQAIVLQDALRNTTARISGQEPVEKSAFMTKRLLNVSKFINSARTSQINKHI